jgi:hypothetical protein
MTYKFLASVPVFEPFRKLRRKNIDGILGIQVEGNDMITKIS